MVIWCIKEDEFIKYGEELLEVYSDPEKEEWMVSDIRKALAGLKEVEEEVEVPD